MHLLTTHRNAKPQIIFMGIGLSMIFALNLFWEILQSPLYVGSSLSWEHFVICLKGAAGDVMLSLIVLAPFFILFKNSYTSVSRKGYLCLTLMGMFVGIMVEQYALATERWAYASTMPIVPFFHVGLMPALQLGILTPLAVWLTHRGVRIAKKEMPRY